jgi:hypothetical protein
VDLDRVGPRSLVRERVRRSAPRVYALFHEIGSSERLVTLIVLVVATVQIVISRPRAPVR